MSKVTKSSKKVVEETSSSSEEIVIKEKKPTRRVSAKKEVKKEAEKEIVKEVVKEKEWTELNDLPVDKIDDSSSSESEDEKPNTNTFRSGERSQVRTSNQTHLRSKSQGRGAKYTTSSINFDYSLFKDLETPVNELNSKDLVKILIVRSHQDNQLQLNKTMKQVLKAMNLECNFPVTEYVRESFSKPSFKTDDSEKTDFTERSRVSFAERSDRPNFAERGGYSGRGRFSGERGRGGRFPQTRTSFTKDE